MIADLELGSLSARRLLLGMHLLVWIVLAAYGLHRLHLIRLYRRRERLRDVRRIHPNGPL